MPSPLEILCARAEARAMLWREAYYPNLEMAVAPLLDAAYEQGIIAQHGERFFFDLINEAFDLAEGELSL